MPEITVQRLLEEFEAAEKKTKKYNTTAVFLKFVYPIIWHGKSYKAEIVRAGKHIFTIRIMRVKGIENERD